MYRNSDKDIILTQPTGGFPPFVICDKYTKKSDDDDDIKLRGFTKNDGAIVASLKDIMGERRVEVQPFITF
jgi:hypothetical protein